MRNWLPLTAFMLGRVVFDEEGLTSRSGPGRDAPVATRRVAAIAEIDWSQLVRIDLSRFPIRHPFILYVSESKVY